MADQTPMTIPRHGYRHRHGLPTITGPMMAVLIRLRAAQTSGSPFDTLIDVDGRTIRALEGRDWIVSSPSRLTCTYYRITGRGLRALEVYEPVARRTDGLCPRCCERPRALRSKGRLVGQPAPYCKECANRQGKRKRLLGLYTPRKQGICVRCQKRPRFVASSGRAYSHCQRCKNLLHRREHKRQRKALLKRILAGETITCPRPGCDQPRYVSGESVQEYCREHYYEYQRDYNARRKARRAAQRERKHFGRSTNL